MKNIALILASLILLNATPAEAATKGKFYKTYHIFVYYPLAAVCFLMSAPTMVISHVNQHFDDLLKQEADQEVVDQPTE